MLQNKDVIKDNNFTPIESIDIVSGINIKATTDYHSFQAWGSIEHRCIL